MKHLFVGQSDYAACGQMFARALESIGEETRSYTGKESIFAYPDYPTVLDAQLFRASWPNMIQWADWVWLVQSDLPKALGGMRGNNPKPYHVSEIGMTAHDSLKGKQVVMLNGGGYYRKRRYRYAQVFPGAISLCYSADLMGAYEREHLVIPPVDLKYFAQRKGRTLFGHFPSRPEDKGSAMILDVLRAKTDNFTANTSGMGVASRVTWMKQLDQMAQCKVIIDQIQKEIDGLRVGEWVSIATEAAALGKISIANSWNTKPYVATYGEQPGIHICNTRAALEREVDRILSLSTQKLAAEQRESREWIKRHHTIERTGKLLQSLLF